MNKNQTGELLATDLLAQVRAAQQGDQAAWTRLYQHFYKKVYRAVENDLWTNSDVEDVVHEVFMKFFKHLHNLHDSGCVTVWIRTIQKRECHRHNSQKAKRGRQVLWDSWLLMAAKEATPVYQLEVEEETAWLLSQVAQLPLKQQEAVRLYYFQEKSVRQVAQAMNEAEGSVKRWLFNARQQLKTDWNLPA